VALKRAGWLQRVLVVIAPYVNGFVDNSLWNARPRLNEALLELSCVKHCSLVNSRCAPSPEKFSIFELNKASFGAFWVLFLWPPYVIGQAIIFLSCGFYLSSIFYLSFPRLISAAGDWMSTILPHMVWP